MPLLDFIPILGDISAAIRKAVPDATERDRIEGELEKAKQGIQQAQSEITKIEAQSPSLFKSGWRPSIGWTCAAGVFLEFILFPLVSMVLQILGKAAIASPLDIASLLALLAALLGMGSLRTAERIGGKV